MTAGFLQYDAPMRRFRLLSGLFFTFALSTATAAAEGVGLLDPGLYVLTTSIETETTDPGTGTLLGSWAEPYSGAACLASEAERRVRPDTFADERCAFSNVRPNPYGEAFEVICLFPEGVLTGAGTLAVDPVWPDEFRETFTLRGGGIVSSQRVTIAGRRAGDCPVLDDPLAGQ